jgi:hypothetical protein
LGKRRGREGTISILGGSVGEEERERRNHFHLRRFSWGRGKEKKNHIHPRRFSWGRGKDRRILIHPRRFSLGIVGGEEEPYPSYEVQ